MRKFSKGFTLIELLVVITIIVIVLGAVGFIVNPPEILSQQRDLVRLTDLANLKQAIETTRQDGGLLCSSGTYPCGGKTTDSAASVRKNDGTGWVKVNFTNLKAISIPTLPLDQPNNSTHHYSYCAIDGDSWEIATILESDKQKGVMQTDGGDDDIKYEVGSNLKLIDHTSGCSY